MTRPPSRRLALALATTGLLATGLAGCSGRSDPSRTADPGYPVTVTDCGSDVEIATRPERVLTVGTSAVTLLDAAGAADRITARTGEFGAGLPVTVSTPVPDDLVLDPADPPTETVLSADPDVVLGYGLFEADPDQVRAAGITVLTVQAECGHDGDGTDEGRDLGSIVADVRRLGTVFGTSGVAEPAADALEQRIAELTLPDRDETAAWLYYFSSEDALSGHGGSGVPQAVLTTAGLTNAYADVGDTYVTVAVEDLLARQPDWVVLTYGFYGEDEATARATFLAEPGVQALDAVSAGRLVMVPATASGSGPEVVDGLADLVAGLGG